MNRIREMLAQAEDGIVTAEQVTRAGIHRGVIAQMVNSGELSHVCRGIYARSDVFEDEFYLLQKRYSKGIFSNETALYLHGYSDRAPQRLTMTFPKGYNSASLKEKNLIIKRVVPANYELGRIEIKSHCGNIICLYNLERTLCDIVRGSGADIQLVLPAMRRYAVAKEKDVHALFRYARQLRVEPKIRHYMEVLL